MNEPITLRKKVLYALYLGYFMMGAFSTYSVTTFAQEKLAETKPVVDITEKILFDKQKTFDVSANDLQVEKIMYQNVKDKLLLISR